MICRLSTCQYRFRSIPTFCAGTVSTRKCNDQPPGAIPPTCMPASCRDWHTGYRHTYSTCTYWPASLRFVALEFPTRASFFFSSSSRLTYLSSLTTRCKVGCKFHFPLVLVGVLRFALHDKISFVQNCHFWFAKFVAHGPCRWTRWPLLRCSVQIWSQ